MNRGRIATYALSHLSVDLATGSVAGLIPVFAVAYGWSYASLGTILLAANLGAAALQPVWGHVADRSGWRFYVPLGLFISAMGIVLVGLAPTYGLVLVAVALAGLGASIFHPDAQRGVHQHAGDHPAGALSWFQVAGNVGISTGPLVVGLLITPSTVYNMRLLGIPDVIMCAVTLWLILNGPKVVRQARALRAARAASGDAASPRSAAEALRRGTEVAAQRAEAPRRATEIASQRAGVATQRAEAPRRATESPAGERLHQAVATLMAMVTVRSFAQIALGIYAALYYQHTFGWSTSSADYLIFAYGTIGAVGTLMGGHLAERIGERRVAMISFGALVVPAAAITLLPPLVGVAAVLLSGFFVMSSWSATISYGQRLMPGRVGMVSGLTTGLTIGTAGIAGQALGWLADVNLVWVLGLGALLAIPAFILARALPELHQRSLPRTAASDAAN